MDRRRFLQAIAVTTGALLEGGQDDLAALRAITAGFQSLEPTTPSGTLWGPVTGHLKLVGDHAGRGPRYAREAAEVARLAAWLAWDRGDHHQASVMYRRAISFAHQSRNPVVLGFMEGSRALWLAETGHGAKAVLPRTGPAGWFSTMQATIASSVGDVDRTLTALQDAEQAGDPPKVLAYTGRAYVRLGLHKAAETALREAIRPMPPTKYKGVLLGELAKVAGEDEATVLRDEARTLGRQLQSQRVLAEVA